jgi:hypothetical protein
MIFINIWRRKINRAIMRDLDEVIEEREFK